MSVDATGNRYSAVRRLLESAPDSAPINGELRASPSHPAVMATPIAVAVWTGKASQTIAMVVGNTGPMANPAANTVIAASWGSLVSSIRYVAIAIAIGQA